MGDIETVIGNKSFYGTELRKKGNIDIERLHKEVAAWFSKYKYFFNEKDMTSSDLTQGREQKIVWIASRKIDSYFRFHIEIQILVYRWLNEKAEVTIGFKGYLEKDYRNFFEKYGKLGIGLRNLYEDLVINDKIQKLKRKVLFETSEVIDEAKKALSFTTR